MIWRDDDIWYKTTGPKLDRLLLVDDVFQRYQVPHTLAVLAARLDENMELVQAIKERHMIVQVHGWNHDDLSKDAQARAELLPAVEMLEGLFGVRPTVLYPPWNRTCEALRETCETLGLTVSSRKLSLGQYIRFEGDLPDTTINFHFWDETEFAQIPPALALYRKRNPL